MGKAPAVLVVLGVGWIVVVPAHAQSDVTPPPRAPRSGNTPAPNVFNLQRNKLGTGGIAKAARARIEAGDCTGALDLLDDALRTSLDATLYRDRGTCHERMGHPYPAIEDYRTYLTNAPDAADASTVRERLERLQGDIQGGPRRHVAVDDDIPPTAPAVARDSRKRSKMGGEDTRGEDSDSASGRSTTGGAGDAHGDEKGHDGWSVGHDGSSDDPDAPDDEEEPPALRNGRGWALAPFIGGRAWVRGTSLTNGASWSQALGAEIRYSMGAHTAILLEAGYERFDSTNIDAETVSGLTSLVELEFRFAANPRYDDQLLVAPGLGFEYLSFEPGSASASSSYSEGAPTARVRVGYRHMLARAVAFDLTLDGGVAQFLKMRNASFDTHGSTGAIAGLNIGFFWGL